MRRDPEEVCARSVSDLLRSYPRAARQRIQGHSLSKKDPSDGASDGSTVFDWRELFALTDMPFDPVVQ